MRPRVQAHLTDIARLAEMRLPLWKLDRQFNNKLPVQFQVRRLKSVRKTIILLPV